MSTMQLTNQGMSLSEILTHLMFQKRIRTAQLARETKLPQPTVHRMVVGATPHPHRSSLEPLAEYFQVTIDQLKGLEPIPWLKPDSANTPGWSQVPVISWEQALQWNATTQHPATEKMLTDAKVSEQAFALVMKDASMEPQFPKGTLLIVDPQKTAKDRSFVIVNIKGHSEVVFRQLILDGPDRYLKPMSPNFEHFKMAMLSADDQIIGVLAQARRDYDEE